MKEYGTISSPYFNEVALQEILQHNVLLMREMALLASFFILEESYPDGYQGA